MSLSIRKQVFRLGAAVVAMFLAAPASAGTITITNATPGLFDASSDTRLFTVTGFEAGFGTGTITDVDISIIARRRKAAK
jgi:hypothetical protein